MAPGLSSRLTLASQTGDRPVLFTRWLTSYAGDCWQANRSRKEPPMNADKR
jgi:hypothetical protein